MRLGLVVASEMTPEVIPRIAALAEDSGFDDLWIAEDGFAGGVVTASALALARTERIRVGLGVASALVRHPAVLAMEIAAVTRNFPERFVAGIGLGVVPWLEQMGLATSQQLAAVGECVNSLRGLLAGDTVTETFRHFSVTGVALTYPPLSAVPIHVGATGPRMLEMAGAIADGTVLSVGSSEQYIRWAKRHIEKGLVTQPNGRPHELTAFAIYSIHQDRDVALRSARRALAHHLDHSAPSALTAAYGIDPSIAELRGSNIEEFEVAMPTSWIEDLTIAGDPDDCVAQIRRLALAGADAVALLPADGSKSEEMITLTGSEVCPRL